MEIIREETACFTGHRFFSKEERERLHSEVEKSVRELISRGYNTFICGGALGFDTLAQQVVLKLREELPFIRVIMAIPCENQDAKWSASDRAVYRSLCAQADECVVLAKEYTPACMHIRNRYMVDNSSVVIAYYTGRNGGTAKTVQYAGSTGVPIIHLASRTDR